VKRGSGDFSEQSFPGSARFRSAPAGTLPVEGLRMRRAIAAAQTGDLGAAHFLYASYKDNVYGYVRSLVGNEHDAEDVTQAVFAKLLIVIGKYRRQAGSAFGAWLLRIARNTAMDHLRRRRDVLDDDPQERRLPAGPIARDGHLLDALGLLPPEQQRVILMRHLLGMTPGEIATQLGRTEASIHGLHHRGRLHLRRELERCGGAPSCLREAA
jgi:RNA polymerase sigma-70 factor (ECF subfamily)